MKKLSIKIAFVACIICGVCIFAHKNKEVHNLTFNNVEALAGGEGGGSTTSCLGTGSIDCYGHYVEIKISGVSLEVE